MLQHPMSLTSERKGTVQITPELCREALAFALKFGSESAWNRFYDLAYRYKGGKVSRKEIEECVYRKYFRGGVK